MSPVAVLTSDETEPASGFERVASRIGKAASGDAPVLPDELLTRARRQRAQVGAGSIERTVLLGIVLAGLENVPFEDAAALLDVKPARLEKMMHGDESIPDNRKDRWEQLAEVLRNLHSVVRADATWRWLNTAVPEFGGRTPREVARERRGLERLVELTIRYRDPSFS